MWKYLLPGILLPTIALSALNPDDALFPTNTQKPGEEPPPAAEVAAAWKVPDGFKVTLFAAEPDVRQPIDMKFDERGRVWICESYSYGEWKRKGEDRIIILEDKDNDGVADGRKIFRGGFHHLSSVEIGLGGVWVLDSPNLLFFPDANKDDVPDGEPEVILEGWTTKSDHNLVNGLTWGPDGWLYGRHGITQPSMVGKKGTPEKDRTFVEPGIWRVHPQTHEFQIICKGSTNPWGLDWDENGEMFMSGNVNGHLWHVIPGSLFERMFGSGSVPHDYERLKMIGETTHYPTSGDWKQDWNKNEKGRDNTNALGGGHSHCGLMIYQGNNWPAQYRGAHFMCNTHGRRINQESTERDGCTYKSKHVGDIAVCNSPWFRGVSVISGPDGAVLVSDWCDLGECHDHDGVHRTSGRIYKISYGEPKKQSPPDLSKWSNEELVKTIQSDNIWHFRTARQILQERWTLKPGKKPELMPREMLFSGTDQQRLRALWMQASCGVGAEEDHLLLTESKNPHIRLWAARVLTDHTLKSDTVRKKIREFAGLERDQLALAHCYGLLQRWPENDAGDLLKALSKFANPEWDRRLELLAWYAMEPFAHRDPEGCASLLNPMSGGLNYEFLARRCGVSIDQEKFASGAGILLLQVQQWGVPIETKRRILNGLAHGIVQKKAHANFLSGWNNQRHMLLLEFPAEATALAIALGDTAVLDHLRERLRDPKTLPDDPQAKPAALMTSLHPNARAAALASLHQARVPDLQALATAAFAEPALRLTAIRAFAEAKDDAPKDTILATWKDLSADEKSAAIDTLTTRNNWAVALLQALRGGKVAPKDISMTQARNLSLIKDPAIDDLLAKHWGKIGQSSEEKRAELARYKKILAGAAGDKAAGQAVFARTCAACHRLFNQGGALGPDLTGSGRKDADYILLNVLDPSAAVQRDYQMLSIKTKDGQFLTGTAPREDDTSLTLQSLTGEQRVLEKSTCTSIERHPFSIMPEGLLLALSDQEVRDLLAYLASDG